MPPELDGRSWERFVVRVSAGRRAAHLHLLAPGTPQGDERRRFRDALRADPELVAAYAALKADLALANRQDREAYTAAKTNFVRAVLNHDG